MCSKINFALVSREMRARLSGLPVRWGSLSPLVRPILSKSRVGNDSLCYFHSLPFTATAISSVQIAKCPRLDNVIANKKNNR